MKIADLFVALGFDIKGEEKLPKIGETITTIEKKAGGATLRLGVMTAAIIAMMETARTAAVVLKDFALTSDLSTMALQEGAHAAEVNDVSLQEYAETLKGIQQAGASWQLTGQLAPAWRLLGIDPREDPRKVLDQIRVVMQRLDAPTARNLASQMGISDNMLQMLRQTNHEFEQLQQKFFVTQKEQDQLIRMNRAWKDLAFNVGAVKNRFAAELAPAFTVVLRGINWLVGAIGTFVDWLSRGGVLAGVVKVALVVLAVAVAALGLAFGGVAAAAGLAAIAIALFQGLAAVAALQTLGLAGVVGILTGAFAALWAVLLPLWPILALISVIALVAVGAMAALVLVVNDVWTAFRGGKSVVGDILQSILELGRMIGGIFGGLGSSIAKVWRIIVDDVAAGIRQLKALMPAWLLNGLGHITADFGAPSAADSAARPSSAIDQARDIALQPAGGTTKTVNIRQDINAPIRVDGSKEPRVTGRAVKDSLNSALSNAAYQAPLLGF